MQELNDEADRFFEFDRKVRSGEEQQETVDQVILINGLKEQVEDGDWIGVIQTFKKFINESVVTLLVEKYDAIKAA